MDIYFLKAFISDSYIGLNGIHNVIEHFMRNEQDISNLTYTIIKACKAIEEWTLGVRLKTKSPFVYGLSENDIETLNENEQIKLLQKYCNIYVLLYHLSKMTLDNLDIDYQEHINIKLLSNEIMEVIHYVEESDREMGDKWNRTVF